MLASTVIFLICLVVFSYLVKRSADRFEARKRAAGDWDENGPKHPSKGDERYRVQYMGGSLFTNLFRDKSSTAEGAESRSEQSGEQGPTGER
jgi:hypothetical protein